MSLNINREKEYIKDVQRLLREISHSNKSIPLLAIDGIYDKEMANAVRAFEMSEGFLITGEVDYTRHKRMCDIASKIKEKSMHNNPLYMDFDINNLKPSETGYRVFLVQSLLLKITTCHKNFEKQSVTGVVDESTVRNIKTLQKIFGIPPTSIIDGKTWRSIVHLFSHCARC